MHQIVGGNGTGIENESRDIGKHQPKSSTQPKDQMHQMTIEYVQLVTSINHAQVFSIRREVKPSSMQLQILYQN